MCPPTNHRTPPKSCSSYRPSSSTWPRSSATRNEPSKHTSTGSTDSSNWARWRRPSRSSKPWPSSHKELRQPAQKWLMAACEARQALLEGRFADAERLITEAHDVGESAQSWNAAVTYRLQLYVLRREQGRLEQLEESVRRSVEEYPTYPIWRCVLAHMAAELGHEAESRQAFAALATDDFAGVPFEDQWLVSVGFLAETASSLGDPRAAVVLYRLFLPSADRVAVSYPEICTGSVSHYLGILATTMARQADAECHFQAALQTNEHIGARPWLAHTQHDYARMLLARKSPGDRDRALELLADARSNYHDLGMHAWAKRSSVVDQPTKRLRRQHLKNWHSRLPATKPVASRAAPSASGGAGVAVATSQTHAQMSAASVSSRPGPLLRFLAKGGGRSGPRCWKVGSRWGG